MRIAYFLEWDASRESGVLKKIAGQVREWTKRGNEVKLFVITPADQVWVGINDLSIELFKSTRVRQNFYYTIQLAKRIKEWKPDLIYSRFVLYYPALETIVKSFPLVYEINSNDLAEYKINFPSYLYFYHRLTRRRALMISRGMIFVTEEIADLFKPYSQSKAVISNGIQLSEYPVSPAPQNGNPKLVFIGSPDHKWHGIDQILWLAHQFPQWRFDLIGLGKSIIGPVTDNISLYPLLSKEQYEKLLLSADVAFGSLALYRTGLFQACPLKVREYLAYGLPTIIGYQDADFHQPVPFLLQLPPCEGNVQSNVVKIAKFIDLWKGKRVSRDQIAHLDITYKETQRLAFFEYVIQSKFHL